MQIDMQAENDDCHSTVFIMKLNAKPKTKKKQKKTTRSAENTEISSMYGFNASPEKNNCWKISSRIGLRLQKWINENSDDWWWRHSNECNLNGENCKLKTIFFFCVLRCKAKERKRSIIYLLRLTSRPEKKIFSETYAEIERRARISTWFNHSSNWVFRAHLVHENSAQITANENEMISLVWLSKISYKTNNMRQPNQNRLQRFAYPYFSTVILSWKCNSFCNKISARL